MSRSYFLTLLEEKGIDLDLPFEVESLHTGTPNHMTLRHVVEFISRKPASVQNVLRKKAIVIDFRNGDVLDLFRYVARFMALDLPVAASHS